MQARFSEDLGLFTPPLAMNCKSATGNCAPHKILFDTTGPAAVAYPIMTSLTHRHHHHHHGANVSAEACA